MAPVRSRQPQARALETRERLVASALHEFAERGFGGASTRHITERAGVALASLPYHFKTKDALWRAAADHIFGVFIEQFTRRIEGLAGVDPLTCLRLVLRDFVFFSAAHPELHRFLLQDGAEKTARLEWLVERHVRPILDQLQRLFDDLADTGYPVDRDSSQLFYRLVGATATAFAASAQVELLTGRDPFSKASVEAHADAMVRLFFPDPPA